MLQEKTLLTVGCATEDEEHLREIAETGLTTNTEDKWEMAAHLIYLFRKDYDSDRGEGNLQQRVRELYKMNHDMFPKLWPISGNPIQMHHILTANEVEVPRALELLERGEKIRWC